MRSTLRRVVLAASSIAFICFGVMGARSWTRSDTIGWYWRIEADRTEYRRQILSAQGSLLIERYDTRVMDERGLSPELPDHFSPTPSCWSGAARQYRLPSGGLWQRLGFDVTIGKYDVTMSGPHGHEPAKQTTVTRLDWVMVPYWFLACLFGALPLWHAGRWVVRSPAARRRRRGLCARCGYDLRASESGRCPECGTPTGAPPGAA
jgi:hypothetical protein